MVKESIDEKYQKIEHHEHILKRSGMYVGSIKQESSTMWIYNSENKDESEISLREIQYVPGLYKIYDEILVNARDHYIRCIAEDKELCTIIKVNIDIDTGKISVWNNGEGIPVVKNEKLNIYIPSMIFGELLSGSNFNDKNKRKVGGTYGLGAKLTNIFSSQFEIETLDSNTDKKFYQKFTNNMYSKEEPKITSGKGKKSYTKITFIPDFEKFGITGLSNELVALFKKRVYDIAMNVSCKVYYNDEVIHTNNFQKYVDLYFPKDSNHEKVFDLTHDEWKVCVVYDPNDKLEHQNISFINGISTSRGGTHVDHVMNQIVNKLKAVIEKKSKNISVKPAMIKENLILFLDAIIENPEFDTQTKEYLKTKVADFSSTFSASSKFIQKIAKTGVVDNIIMNAQAKAEATLHKSVKVRAHFEKLYPAHKSNTKDGHKCTLILTEGDSAKTFAMSGLNIIGRDYYGVFPLRGKLLNVREATLTKVTDNEEIKAITQIVGLEHKKHYESTKGLKYGKILILTDQDVDGSHIKGLIINFIHYYWPSLVMCTDFIRYVTTPLLKIVKGKGKKCKVLSFTSVGEYEKWKSENDNGKGWSEPKYYKGLGTSTAKEAQECFKDLDDKEIIYYWQSKLENENDEDIESYQPKLKDVSEDAITLAFDKKRADDRKIWLKTYDVENYLDANERKVSYFDFVHRELIAFSIYDNVRSIPNIMDGFKPSQRKVYFGSLYENIYNSEIKVAQLSGSISQRTAYHHGEQSLNETIIGMAQNFVGKNNINILIPSGQFGSRLCGGKDAASPRYIFTQLDALGKKIFIDVDNDILISQKEEGKQIEPVYYAPIIPMILVNGSEGIGTGYSTSIEPCNPRDICNNLKRIIDGKKPRSMIPWYRHFTGTITKMDDYNYICKGNYTIVDDKTIHITDLPIGIWTDNYKSFLDNLLQSQITSKNEDKSKKKKKTSKKSNTSNTSKVSKANKIGSYIKNYTENCTEIRISFTITFHDNKLQELIDKGRLEKDLKLIVPFKLSNMHLFDEKGKIKKYDSYKEILIDFSHVRLELYQKRKDFLLGKWKKEMDILGWKVKFIIGVRDGEIIIFDTKNKTSKKKEEVLSQLEKLKFPKFALNNENTISYNYLTNTGLFNLTQEEIDKLLGQLKNKETEIALLESKSPSQIWNEELDSFLEAYDIWENEKKIEYDNLLESKKKKKSNK